MSKEVTKNFKDCLYGALDTISAMTKTEVVISKKTSMIVSIMWNILCVEQNKLDDLIYINDNNDICKIPIAIVKNAIEPLQESVKKSAAKKTTEKDDSDVNLVEDENVEEKTE